MNNYAKLNDVRKNAQQSDALKKEELKKTNGGMSISIVEDGIRSICPLYGIRFWELFL